MSRALACILVAVLFGAASALRTVCYYTNWAQYRNGAAKFLPENVDPSLCTHLIYAFAKMNGNHLAAFEWNDESTAWSKGMYERFHDLKAQNPSLKLLLSVGGWNMGSPPFTAMVASDANRREFARTSIAFLRKNNFDGLDVDWEYPANRGSPPEDKGRYVQLLQTLRDAFDAESVPAGKDTLMLAAAVGAGKEKIDTGYDVPKVAQLLDMINLMTYDLHGSWEDHTGHHSALYARTGETGDDLTLNVNWAAQQWVQKGAPRSKINIGVPLYGRTFKLPSGHSNELIGCPASGAGPAGTFTREAGFMSWYEICTKLPTANKHFDTEQQVPYMVKDNLWVGYEDPDSLRIKVDYIKKENFGGVMVWALDLDDFSGMCSTHVKYPLMRAIKDEIDNGLSSTYVTDSTTLKTTSTTVRTTPSTKRSTTQSTTTSTTMRTTKQTQPPPVTAAPPSSKAPVTFTNAPKTTKVPTTVQPATTKPSTSKHSVIPVPSTEFDCSMRFTGYYPSPTSCSSFYICAAGNSFKTDCHPGLVFNPQTLYCDFPDHVTCYAHNPLSSPTKAAQPMRIPTLQSSTKGSNNLGFCHGKSDGYYKDPKDCAGFYECVYGFTYHLSCSLGLFYNENTRGSGSHHQLTQVTQGEFDCAGKNDGYYPSATSCSSFYICAGGMAFVTDCHPGLVFDPNSLYCDFPDHVTCYAQNSAAIKTTTTTAPKTPAPITTSAPPKTPAPITTRAPPKTPAPTTASTTKPTTASTGRQTTVARSPADFCVGKTDGFYRDPKDCSFFYQCSFERAYHETCPAGTYFDAKRLGCDWAANVPCP